MDTYETNNAHLDGRTQLVEYFNNLGSLHPYQILLDTVALGNLEVSN